MRLERINAVLLQRLVSRKINLFMVKANFIIIFKSCRSYLDILKRFFSLQYVALSQSSCKYIPKQQPFSIFSVNEHCSFKSSHLVSPTFPFKLNLTSVHRIVTFQLFDFDNPSAQLFNYVNKLTGLFLLHNSY